jgi:hypothetical protein
MKPDAVSHAVDSLLASYELDELGQARAAIARTLAAKLDDARELKAASVFIALPSLSKELRETLAAISDSQMDVEEFVTGLFSET